jgi:hypothetical protein
VVVELRRIGVRLLSAGTVSRSETLLSLALLPSRRPYRMATVGQELSVARVGFPVG